MMMGIERLVVRLKSKLKGLKAKRSSSLSTSTSSCTSRSSSSCSSNYDYDKIDKSESMRVEIRSRKAQKLIAETLKIADSPTRMNRTYDF